MKAFTLAALVAAGPAMACPTFDFARVIDGDTFEGIAGERVRLAGVDAPETSHRAQCAREELEGLIATVTVERLLTNARHITYCSHGLDKYERTLADVYVDGESLAEILLERKLAKRWTGRKADWCPQ